MNSRDVKVYPSKSRTDAHDRAARFAGELNTTALAKAAAGRNAFVVRGNTVDAGKLLAGTIFMRGYLFTTKAESTLEMGKDDDTLACWQIEVGSDGTSIGAEALLVGGDTTADPDNSTYSGLSLVYVARDGFSESEYDGEKNIVTLPVAIMTQSGWKTFDYGYKIIADTGELQVNINENMQYKLGIGDNLNAISIYQDGDSVDLQIDGGIKVKNANGDFVKLDPTTDADKPVSTAQKEALDTKVDKVTGKGLSKEDYTTAEKTKLSGISSGAQVNSVTSVAGRTGAVTLAKTDIGLDNVDNTSDANKPISTEQKAALGLIASNYTIKDLGMRIRSKVPFNERFEAKTWTGLTSFYGDLIWTDGTNIYYSGGTSEQYKLDVGTSTWSLKNWNGFTDFYGRYIWTDGTNIYYSHGSDQYKLDVGTSTWSLKNWNGLTIYFADNIWTDGTSIYYSGGTSEQYKLDVGTSTWSLKNWNGFTDFYDVNIWTDGTNTYYSAGSNQYKLDIGTSTWSLKNWNGITNFNGRFIWTDGTNTYYSHGTTQYKFIPKRIAEDALSITQTAVEEVKNNYMPKNNMVWQGAATATDGIELNLQFLSTGTYLITKIAGGTSINIQDASVPDHVMSATAFIANVIGDAIRVFTIGGVTDEIYSYQNGLACSVDAGGGDLAIIRLN